MPTQNPIIIMDDCLASRNNWVDVRPLIENHKHINYVSFMTYVSTNKHMS